jgi:hypothetical protein
MPPQRLSRISLGAVGLEHIKNRLRVNKYAAGKPMRRALAQIPLEQGEAWTWAPRGWAPTLEDLRDESLPFGITQTHHRDLLVHFVLRYLAANGHLAIIEDDVATPNDPFLTEVPILPQCIGFGDHVYWYATEPDIAVVRKVLVWGLGFFQCMALTHRRGDWPPRRIVNSRQIESLSHAADHFVVDAFDFWGTVVWSRRRKL